MTNPQPGGPTSNGGHQQQIPQPNQAAAVATRTLELPTLQPTGVPGTIDQPITRGRARAEKITLRSIRNADRQVVTLNKEARGMGGGVGI